MAVAGAVLSIDDPAINDVRDILGISRQVDNPEPIVESAVNVTVPRQYSASTASNNLVKFRSRLIKP
jgi:hypothetical protein